MNECCRGTFSTTNLTWTVLGLNLSLHDRRLATAASPVALPSLLQVQPVSCVFSLLDSEFRHCNEEYI